MSNICKSNTKKSTTDKSKMFDMVVFYETTNDTLETNRMNHRHSKNV